MENTSKIKDFTDLKVWQEGHQLVLQIYTITSGFPKTETFSLCDQMKRAASSITANIAEGFGRHSYKEKIQFYYQAQGSLVELKNFLILSKDVKYIDLSMFEKILEQSNLTHRLLQGLITKSKSFVNLKS